MLTKEEYKRINSMAGGRRRVYKGCCDCKKKMFGGERLIDLPLEEFVASLFEKAPGGREYIRDPSDNSIDWISEFFVRQAHNEYGGSPYGLEMTIINEIEYISRMEFYEDSLIKTVQRIYKKLLDSSKPLMSVYEKQDYRDYLPTEYMNDIDINIVDANLTNLKNLLDDIKRIKQERLTDMKKAQPTLKRTLINQEIEKLINEAKSKERDSFYVYLSSKFISDYDRIYKRDNVDIVKKIIQTGKYPNGYYPSKPNNSNPDGHSQIYIDTYNKIFLADPDKYKMIGDNCSIDVPDEYFYLDLLKKNPYHDEYLREENIKLIDWKSEKVSRVHNILTRHNRINGEEEIKQVIRKVIYEVGLEKDLMRYLKNYEEGLFYFIKELKSTFSYQDLLFNKSTELNKVIFNSSRQDKKHKYLISMIEKLKEKINSLETNRIQREIYLENDRLTTRSILVSNVKEIIIQTFRTKKDNYEEEVYLTNFYKQSLIDKIQNQSAPQVFGGRRKSRKRSSAKSQKRSVKARRTSRKRTSRKKY